VCRISPEIDVTNIDFSKTFELRSKKYTRIAKMELFTDNGSSLIIKFDISNSINDSFKLIGYDVFCSTIDDKKMIRDLTGYLVSDIDGNSWGRVISFSITGLNKIIEVEDDDRIILIPYNEITIKNIDVEKKEITIDPPDGLKDLN